MIFHANRLPADYSHEISYLIFFRKLGKMSQNWLSAAVMIGALSIKVQGHWHFGSGEELYLIWALQPSWSCGLN